MIQESLLLNLPEIKEIGICNSCLQGKVILETIMKNIPTMEGPSILVAIETCYCDNCGVYFHPTVRKKYEADRANYKKPSSRPYD